MAKKSKPNKQVFSSQFSNKMKYIYLLLAVLGTIVHLWQFAGFLTAHGLDLELFASQLFANKISSLFAADVIISAVVTIVFIEYEKRKRDIRFYWVAYFALFLAGVSAGLPLFLFLRENAHQNFLSTR
jgi:hypothetical protein